jgi:hypothetical protein
MHPDSVLVDLEGRWDIARTVHPAGSLTGWASFTRDARGCLAYAEEGQLHLNGGTFTARQRYLFEPRADGFAVWFDAELLRLFHEIALSETPDGLVGEASHPCGRDLYVTSYRFAAGGGFKVRHRVTGPHKDYVMDTVYTRATAQEIAA